MVLKYSWLGIFVHRSSCEIGVGVQTKLNDFDGYRLIIRIVRRGNIRIAPIYICGFAIIAEEIGSGAKVRPKHQELMKIAKRGQIDVVVVWKLDRWGRSLQALANTLA